MSELIEKKEYNGLIFFHGICFDKIGEQEVVQDLELSIDEISGAFTKFSRYCVAGKFNYDEKVLELGLSMIEYPYPYVKKKAREVAANNLANKSFFSIEIPFSVLEKVVDYKLGNEIKTFNNLNVIFKSYRRGSLMHFFKDKKIEKLLA